MKKNSLYALILAGGAGTRFWPLSRKGRPKQFLKILGEMSLFQETLRRIRPMIPGSNIYVVTNAGYLKAIQEQARGYGVLKKNILLEPQGKNTAPAVCWGAARILRENPDAVMAVLPSDHLIAQGKAFLKYLREAERLAQLGYLVTMGIVPTRPETGYGYLKFNTVRAQGRSLIKVERFVEKPTLAKAKAYLKAKRYLWNSGMFIWRCDVVMEAFGQYLPKVYACFRDRCDDAHVKRHWKRLPSISIDYGIMEKARKVAAVPAMDMGWSDVGSWESLWEVSRQDEDGNYLSGDVISVDGQGSLVLGDKRLVAAIGLQDMIVVDTEDALLICPKNRSQDVRRIVDILKRKQRQKVF